MSTQHGVQVVVLTALPEEYDAVRRHLQDRSRCSHPRGIEFEVGTLQGGHGQVAIAELGQGNVDAAVAVTEAVETFQPAAILFVGVAGALHDDLRIGDVVAAVRVHAYQGGAVGDDGLLARPRSYEADRELGQRARVIARDYRERPDAPQVHFRAVAAGDVVLNSRTHELVEQLRTHYNDASAIEMEGAGMVHACHMGRVPALVIRGISDRADGAKELADAAGSKDVAARNAADFAVAVIEDYLADPRRRTTGSTAQPSSSDGRSKVAPQPAEGRTAAPSAVAPAVEPSDGKPLSTEQKNAVRSARDYLKFSAFSRKGLIEQLSSDSGDGYSLEAATRAVDSLDIDYNEQAARSARGYLRNGAFSRKGLIEQLSSDSGDGYSLEAATRAVDSLDIDYNEQAAKSARGYLKNSAFSRKGLIEQLESDAGDGFTHSQAVHGVDQVGL